MAGKIITELSLLLEKNGSKIDEWIRARYKTVSPVIYSSVDVRNSGFKLAPVDVNAFPGGFNNLSAKGKKLATDSFRKFISSEFPSAKNILLIPESHTRNLKYQENVQVITTLLEQAGFLVRPAAVGAGAAESGLEIPKIVKGELVLEGSFRPDLVILNNDLSVEPPEQLRNINQPIVPDIRLGWHNRKKSCYFHHYDKTVRQFADAFGFDPWLISTFSEKCIYMNFKERTGLECVAIAVERVLRKVRMKYDEYGIKEEPYVFIKAESGTYGMGIMTAKSGDDVVNMNKNIRKKMNVIKEGMINSEVIVQEGVPTIDMVSGEAAEPMIYLVGGDYVGGAFRINAERGAYGNMNGPGMSFTNFDEANLDVAISKDKYLQVCAMIARLSSLAAAYEQEFYRAGLTCTEKAKVG